MLTLVTLADPAAVPAAALAAAVEIALAHDERCRSRHVAMRSDGTAVALMLPRGTVLRDGTLLAASDGRLAVVRAAPQAVLRVAAASPPDLLRVVYHLANRHVPMQLGADHVLIEPDPVLARLAASLGATVTAATCKFEPESGAYHGHAHADGPDEAVSAAGAAGGGHAHDLDPEDAAAGRIGEQLSIEAHARRAGAGPA
jgi:urease accessory protein